MTILAVKPAIQEASQTSDCAGIWDEKLRDRLRFRETDRFVKEQPGGRWPLSVSTDMIALPAMRAMALLKRFGVTDRSGDGRFFEVYPAASLRAWGIASSVYKGNAKQKCIDARREIFRNLRKAMPWLTASDAYAEHSDALDALVASLTAHEAKEGRTIPPSPSQAEAARLEGWIHLPSGIPQP